MLRKLRVVVVAVVVALAVASPALAQEVRDSETVTVTFRLSVDGQVPGWQHFGVDYPVGGEDVNDIPLCTTGTDSGMAAPPCRSGGTYTASVEVPAGTPLAFDFVRNDTRTSPERFQSEARTFTENATVSAVYHFPGGGSIGYRGGAGAEQPGRKHPLRRRMLESAVADQYTAASGGEASTPPRKHHPAGDAAAGVEAAEGIAGGVLPDTGGAALLLAGAGALLTATGLLVYRRAR